MLSRRSERSHRWLRTVAVVAVASVAAAMIMPAARAQTFATPGGSTDTAGDAVSASAVFTVTAGQIQVTLSNLEVNQSDAGQLVSDLLFRVVGGTLPTAASSLTSSANTVNVLGNGSTTSAGTGVSTGWAYTVSGTQAILNGLNGAANVPAFEIIGPPNGSGVYSHANGSIAGNSAHNPFISESATFTITGTGILATTTIDSGSVIFSFGTTPNDNITGVLVAPEPSALAIAGLGALGFIGFGLRRRLKKVR
jgi:PEP-CTERM motif